MEKKYIAVWLPVVMLIAWAAYTFRNLVKHGEPWQIIVSCIGLVILLSLAVLITMHMRKR